MNNADFENVWKDQIRPFLIRTRGEREKSRRKNMSTTVMYLVLILLVLPAMKMFDEFFKSGFATSGYWPAYIWIPLAVVLLIAVGVRFRSQNNFSKKFTENVIGAISENVTDFSWSIEPPDEDKGADAVKRSQLYGDYARAIDIINIYSGTWDGGKIMAYEDDADDRLRNFDSDKEYKTRNILSGLLIEIPLDKAFRGKTFVQTEEKVSVFGIDLEIMAHDVPETELEWIDFEDFLEVKSTDPTEAREIFTPDFMAVVHDWWKHHDTPLRFSFKESSVFIAYPIAAKLGPSTFGSIEKEKGVIEKITEVFLFTEKVTKIISDQLDVKK